MSCPSTDIKEEYESFTEAWRLWKEYRAIPEHDEAEDEWSNLIEEADRKCNERPGRLMRKLTATILAELEERTRERREKDGQNTN